MIYCRFNKLIERNSSQLCFCGNPVTSIELLNALVVVLATNTLYTAVHESDALLGPVSYTHLTLPTNREV